MNWKIYGQAGTRLGKFGNKPDGVPILMTLLNDKFWQNKRVLLTGHTGFKGAWLAAWLNKLGAKVSALSLPPESSPNLYSILDTPLQKDAHIDLRDVEQVQAFVVQSKPQIVLHLAAQALVRKSYKDPLDTISSNVMGTANLLNALRDCDALEAVLVVTSDKAYDNDISYQGGSDHKFIETDRVGGHDPYSASKGMQELVTKSFYDSYFSLKNIPVATARAGNVIGGGDWAEDRLMTDLIASIANGDDVLLRNPKATRPFQHVLEPLAGYLLFAQSLVEKSTDKGAMNFGPDGSDTVLAAVEKLIDCWGAKSTWQQDGQPSPKEAKTLELDSSLAKAEINWQPILTFDDTISWIVDWYKAQMNGDDMQAFTLNQINMFEDRMNKK